MHSLAAILSSQFVKIIAILVPEGTVIDPQIRRSDFADFQANGILPLAKALRMNPRELANLVAIALSGKEPFGSIEMAGPGFVNITVTDAAIWRQIAAQFADSRLGVATSSGGTTVIDYSQPNIAKEMHVGHLRSTIIGDSLARIFEHLGDKVIRQNHIGDWGTQFGMLIQFIKEHPDQRWGTRPDTEGVSISQLNALYRAAREQFDADAEFADRARHRVVALQAGDPETLSTWREIVAESSSYFNAVYQQLDVLLVEDDAVGESYYNDMLQGVADDLERAGIAVRSDGALCVFFDDFHAPLIVQKSDGGFGYATTDLAAIRHRVTTLAADRILYVVDARQALHFQMVFETARRAEWLPDRVRASHIDFGTVLGPDGKPFKTRAGQTVRLMELLTAAVDRARTVVVEKSPNLPRRVLEERAHQVGIGAVKYADLSTNRTRDYVFDVDRMLALAGNTGVYLQYANARIGAVLRKVGDNAPIPAVRADLPLEPAERRLALQLDDYGDAVAATATTFEPHRLCTYLFNLAQAFTDFYENCPVLKAGDDSTRDNRLVLCHLTRSVLEGGMSLLGIAAPERL